MELNVSIPTKDRPNYLSNCLSGLYAQNYRNFDIHIIDDSEVPVETNPLIRLWVKKLYDIGIETIFYKGTNQGPQSAHNIAINKTRKDWILRVDDDCYLERDYLSKIVPLMDSDSLGAIGGSVPYVKNFQVVRRDPPKEYGRVMKTPDGEFLPVDQQIVIFDTDKAFFVDHIRSTFAYRVDAAKKVGGYPKIYSKVGHREETHFTLSLRLAGYNNLIVPSAICWHFQDYEGVGGIRKDFKNDDDPRLREIQASDEILFQNWMKENWNVL